MASMNHIRGGMVIDAESAGPEPHPGSEEIAAYLDDRLPPAAKSRLQAHLAECTDCRDEVVELVELMEAHERDGRRRWIVPVVAAAAVAAAVLLIAVPVVREEAEGPPTFRAPEAAAEREALRGIAVVSPHGETPIGRTELTFAWESVAPGASYRVTMTDSAGVPIWAAETDQTRMSPPSDLDLEPGARYLWFVDAVLPDGATATSGVQTLHIAP
jgi:hypothetical protein